MKKYLFLLLSICSVMACSDSKTTPTDQSKSKINNTTKMIPASGEFNHGELTFSYTYDESEDTTEITIKGKSEASYSSAGKVQKYFFSDLNADEKDESFIVLKTAKGHSLIKAFYIADGAPIEIFLDQVAYAPDNAKKKYTGQYGQLIEKLEVKTPDNKVIKKEVRYNLIAGEAGYSLKPQGWTREQLKTKRGQYKTGIYGKEKYYNKLYVNESETGEWIVDIKVKDSKTEKNVCEFQAIGEFIDRDLLVPLNPANAKLDGVLIIRFVDQTTIVYTQDKKDFAQMADFCNNKGNLAGNYSKLNILYGE